MGTESSESWDAENRGFSRTGMGAYWVAPSPTGHVAYTPGGPNRCACLVTAAMLPLNATGPATSSFFESAAKDLRGPGAARARGG